MLVVTLEEGVALLQPSVHTLLAQGRHIHNVHSFLNLPSTALAANLGAALHRHNDAAVADRQGLDAQVGGGEVLGERGQQGADERGAVAVGLICNR